MPSPEIALIVCTYQKPSHLRRVLASAAVQRGVRPAQLEVVVTDDGLTDETASVVEQFRREAPFPVRFVTHPHQAFQLARCRNEGFGATTAPYVVFLDGDCILPPDHLAQQLKHRRPGVVMGGYCCRLDRATSQRITTSAVRSGEFMRWIPRSELRKLRVLAWKSSFYSVIGHRSKPRLFGGNIAIWREDYERVNGFDENFVGWGGEDDDMRMRLRAAGIQIRTILHWTRTYHLWHPPDPSAPAKIVQGVNMEYLDRRGRLTKCVNGLRKRSLRDLRVRVRPSAEAASDQRLAPLKIFRADAAERPEIEIVCAPGAARFSGQAECNVLVALAPTPYLSALARDAQLVITDLELPQVEPKRLYRLDSLHRALRDAAGGLD